MENVWTICRGRREREEFLWHRSPSEGQSHSQKGSGFGAGLGGGMGVLSWAITLYFRNGSGSRAFLSPRPAARPARISDDTRHSSWAREQLDALLFQMGFRWPRCLCHLIPLDLVVPRACTYMARLDLFLLPLGFLLPPLLQHPLPPSSVFTSPLPPPYPPAPPEIKSRKSQQQQRYPIADTPLLLFHWHDNPRF